MTKNVRFGKAEGRRTEITKNQRKEIRDMYLKLAEEARMRAEELSHLENISSVIREQYLKELADELSEKAKQISTSIESKVVQNMKAVSMEVVKENQDWLLSVGIRISGAFSYVPNDVVELLVSGKLYKGNWTFSKAIWKDSEKISADLYSIVARGVANQKSTYEIAKDLERYVNPRARKSWSWSKVYPNTRKKIDYNAQRLARTLIQHSYQESFVRTTKNNPFFESYKWLISNSDRVCPICQDRATLDSYGLGPGMFPKNSLPMDHPNGMCSWVIVKSKSLQEVSNDLANWVNGTGDKKLNSQIDKYIKDAYGKDFSNIVKSTVRKI